MLLLLLAVVIYAVLALATSYLLPFLSVPLVLLVIYALPLLLNFIVYKVQKGEWKFWTALVLPTVSVAAYLLFAYLTSSNNLTDRKSVV